MQEEEVERTGVTRVSLLKRDMIKPEKGKEGGREKLVG